MIENFGKYEFFVFIKTSNFFFEITEQLDLSKSIFLNLRKE